MRYQSKRFLNALVFIVGVSALTPVPLAGQTQIDSNPGSTAPNSGLFTGGGYSLNQLESINAVTGTMALNVPLAHLPPGPGGSSPAVNLVYNSTLFDITTTPLICPATICGSWTVLSETASYQPSTHGGGWSYGYQYSLWSQPAANLMRHSPPAVPFPIISGLRLT